MDAHQGENGSYFKVVRRRETNRTKKRGFTDGYDPP